MWFRRDLRLGDNPALLEAAADGPVLPLFVLDPALWGPAGPSRRAYLGASLRSLDGQLRQRRTRLSVVRGDPVRRVVLAAKAVGAERVHIAADYGPYGARRDEDGRGRPEGRRHRAGAHRVAVRRRPGPGAQRLGRALQGLHTVLEGVGRRTAGAGRSTRRAAARGSSSTTDTTDIPDRDAARRARAARGRRGRGPPTLGASTSSRSRDYDDVRNDPGRDATSRMSVHLKWGEIHPRTMLADLAPLRSSGSATYRKELAWREFYADVLHANPASARDYLRPEYAAMPYDEPGVAARGVEARPHRLPGRRRRDAPAEGDRLDAQPGPDDRGQLPGQGPAPRVAARRPALHAVARRRRPRLQPARLAVDRRLRHRRGAVLPGLQPDRPEPQVRPAGQLHPPVGRGAGGPRPGQPTRTTRTRTPATWSATPPDRRPRRGAPGGARPLGADPPLSPSRGADLGSTRVPQGPE